MSIHDDPTQTSPAQPPRKRRPWYRRWYVISPAALAVGIITISAIGTAAKSTPVAHPSSPAASAPANPATSPMPLQQEGVVDGDALGDVAGDRVAVQQAWVATLGRLMEVVDVGPHLASFGLDE